MLEEFTDDFLRCFPGSPVLLRNVLFRPDLPGILLYRLSRHYVVSGDVSADSYAALGRFMSGFEIHYSASIGCGLALVHGLGTVIGARCPVGSNATIYQGVTLSGKNGGRPVLGDNVTVFGGAMIVGKIAGGNNAKMGANSFCFREVPEGATVAGNPARSVSK